MESGLTVMFEETVIAIHDVHGNRWVTANDIARALGSDHAYGFRKLIGQMARRGELKEGRHFMFLPLQTAGGIQRVRVLSHRGVIRTVMRSDAPKAPVMRDWAEEVLFQVMTTGHYSIDGTEPDSAPKGGHGDHPSPEYFWTDGLTPSEYLELVKIRVEIGKSMAADPKNPVWMAIMHETYGGKLGFIEYMNAKKDVKFRFLPSDMPLNDRQDAGATDDRQDAGPTKKKKPSRLDKDPAVKAFVRSLFPNRNMTYHQMSQACREEFGAKRAPGASLIGREREKWERELREAAHQIKKAQDTVGAS